MTTVVVREHVAIAPSGVRVVSTVALHRTGPVRALFATLWYYMHKHKSGATT